MKKSNFQTVIFAIFFLAMNGHTFKLFKNIFSDVHTEGKEEIIRLNISTAMFLDTLSV